MNPSITAPVVNHALVSVYRANDPILAGLAAECLQNNEIPFIRKEDARALDGGLEVSVGTIELLVAEEHFTDASLAIKKWDLLRNIAESGIYKAPIPPRSYKELISIAGIQFVAATLMISFVGFRWDRCIIWMMFWLLALVNLIRCGKVYAYWRHLRTIGYEWPTLDVAYAVVRFLPPRTSRCCPGSGGMRTGFTISSFASTTTSMRP